MEVIGGGAASLKRPVSFCVFLWAMVFRHLVQVNVGSRVEGGGSVSVAGGVPSALPLSVYNGGGRETAPGMHLTSAGGKVVFESGVQSGYRWLQERFGGRKVRRLLQVLGGSWGQTESGGAE